MSPRLQEPIRRIATSDGSTRWRVVVDTGEGPGGRRRQATRTFKTHKEARAFLASVRVQVAGGTYVAPSTMTVEQYLEQWLESRRHSLRPKTLEGYRCALRRAVDRFGSKRLERLDKADLVDLIDDLKTGQRPLTARSINLTVGVLRQAFNAAVREGVLMRNPAQLVDLLPQPAKEMNAWTADEAGAFLAATAEHRWAGPFALSLSGLRRGEVLGLRWSDVDLSGAAPHVVVRRSRVQLGAAGGGISEGDPKSARSRRRVPLAPYAVTAMLATQRRQRVERAAAGTAYENEGFVCCDELGRPPRPETYSTVFRRLVAKAELRPIRLHDLRHTSVSLLLGAGVPVHVVANIHGHDPVITQRIYAHTQTQEAVAAMDTLDQILRPDQPATRRPGAARRRPPEAGTDAVVRVL